MRLDAIFILLNFCQLASIKPNALIQLLGIYLFVLYVYLEEIIGNSRHAVPR